MKLRNLGKKMSACLLTFAMIMPMFPQMSMEVHAAELPTESQFATKEQLMTFDTRNDTTKADGTQNEAKVYFGNNNQKWWIAGNDTNSPNKDNSIVLFAESPLLTDQTFERGFSSKPYDPAWNCTYEGNPPTEILCNHYGASRVRLETLNALETSYFTKAEQDLMNDTTIYTNAKYTSVYSTTDTLYLAYGNKNVNYIMVGKNSNTNLNDGLKVDMNYWGTNSFWLRAPNIDKNLEALFAYPRYNVYGSAVENHSALVPAFELNLPSVIFGSTARISPDGQLNIDDAFTLRYQGTVGNATLSQSKQSAVVTGVTNDNTYLVVQNNDGAWAKKVANSDVMFANEMSETLTSFENCRVWLETTDTVNRMTYASEATQGNAHNVKVNAGQNMTITNNIQTGVAGKITDVTATADSGYYLPDNYKDSVTLPTGCNITQNGNEVTISGTPTSDVLISLPDATAMPKADTPQVEISKTSTSISATVTNYQEKFGTIEYKWDSGEWGTDSTLSNLTPNSTHTLSVRFAGQGIYQMSEETTLNDITTLQDGSTEINVPTGLTATYNEDLKLSDVALSNGWYWVNENTSLVAGTSSYPARFDTTDLESTHDFTNVTGYNAQGHYVERDIEVVVDKADSTVTITTDSLDKTYDKDSVSEPAYTTTGSTGAVTITWKKNTGTAEAPNWETITNAPSDAGSYQVIVTVAEDSNYNSAEDTLEFVIAQATNEWTDRLSMNGWTYNEEQNTPTATAKFGDVVFTYSTEENGTYTAEVPTDAGTYYVKATIVGNDNYTGLEETVTFDIEKAIPTPETITGLVLGQGQALEMLQLPKGFAWEDETIVVDELGNYQFKAIYTPADTTNYETVEVMLDVEVVPMMTPLNHVPTITAKDITLTVGDKFNDKIALKDVTATDTEDGDITKDIKVIKNTVDTSKAGIYEVSYQVTDSQGASVTKTVKVVVKAKPAISDKTDSAVKTGDQTNVSLYIMLAGLSALIITLLTVMKRRMQHERR